MVSNFKFIRLIIIILIVLTNITNLYTQESGWVQHNSYYQQKLVKSGLVQIGFNYDGSQFFTLMANNKVFIWSTNTGFLEDSLQLDSDAKIINFSEDGYSIIAFKSTSDYLFSEIRGYLTIYNLITKKIISHSFLKIDCKPYLPTYSGQIENYDFTFSVNDYNIKNNQLSLGLKFLNIITENLPGWNKIRSMCGSGLLFDVRQDTLILLKTISKTAVNDLCLFNSYSYFTAESRTNEINKYGDNSCYNYFSLNKLHLNDQKITEIKKDVFKFDSRDTSGINIPYSRISIDSLNNKIFLNVGDNYYCFNLSTNNLIDSLHLPDSRTLDCFSNEFDKICFFNNSKIIVYSVNDKIVLDSITCSIVPNTLNINKTNNDIIVSDSIGNILLFKYFLSTNCSFVKDNSFFLFPNPISGLGVLYADSLNFGLIELDIYSLSGLHIKSLKHDNSNASIQIPINLGFLPNGTYYIYCRHNNDNFGLIKFIVDK